MYARETKVKSNLETDTGKKANKTGLPYRLKYGIENISGYSMDDVRVHYNSAKPAQLQSLAYTQGSEIYIAPGQERHLGHEAWHVVQQKQGRVAPTEQVKGININSSRSLEQEADTMGAKVIQMQFSNPAINLKNAGAVPCVQKMSKDLHCTAVIKYKGVKDPVKGDGCNNSDKDAVLNIFRQYDFNKLAAWKGVPDSNPPGQCAEPHALAAALIGGQKKRNEIESVTITPAHYTDAFRTRIIDEIDNKSIPEDDEGMVNAMLKDNHISYYSNEKRKRYCKIEDIIKDDVSEIIGSLKSDISRKDLIRNRCQTCLEWVSNGGNVDDNYLKSEEELNLRNEYNENKQKMQSAIPLISQDLYNKRSMKKNVLQLIGNAQEFINAYSIVKQLNEKVNMLPDSFVQADDLVKGLKEKQGELAKLDQLKTDELFKLMQEKGF